MSSAPLVLPIDLTTPHDSFRLFIWNYRVLAFLTLYVTGVKLDSNPGPFVKGSSDLTTQTSSYQTHLLVSVAYGSKASKNSKGWA